MASSRDSVSFKQRFEESLNPSNDGSQGKFRAPIENALIQLKDDSEAINTFLNESIAVETTRRMYKKEAERLHLWAVLYLNKAVSDMDMTDFYNYLEFLKNPNIEWVADRKHNSDDFRWRPFVRDLDDRGKPVEISENALLAAISALNTMMTWFVNSGYMSGNPLGLIRKKFKKTGSRDEHEDKIDRYLNDDIINDIKFVIDALPRAETRDIMKYERMRFLFSMFLLLGPRVSELSGSQMRDFKKTPAGWFWSVIGKGSKPARVSVPNDMIDALRRWRKVLGLSPLPLSNDKSPVLPIYNKSGVEARKQKLEGGLSPRRINEVLSEIFEMTIIHINQTQAGRDAEEKTIFLSQASAHWLRHTSITQKVNAGMDRASVQMDARHNDARTTARYIHDQDDKRSEDAQKHRLNWE